MTNLRPDEAAAMSEIERARRRDSTLKKGVKTAVGIGASALGAGVSAKILPFLSEFIPQDLAMKGISKVSPKIGEFLKKGRDMGLDVKQGFEYLKNKISPKTETQPANQTQQEENIISKYSPELHDFLKDKIGQGLQPLAVALQATQNPKYKQIIEKMQKETGQKFSDIINSIFGGQQQAQPMAQQPQQPQQPQAPQQGQGAQDLMQMLQQLIAKRGGK